MKKNQLSGFKLSVIAALGGNHDSVKDVSLSKTRPGDVIVLLSDKVAADLKIAKKLEGNAGQILRTIEKAQGEGYCGPDMIKVKVRGGDWHCIPVLPTVQVVRIRNEENAISHDHVPTMQAQLNAYLTGRLKVKGAIIGTFEEIREQLADAAKAAGYKISFESVPAAA